jgi:hypothetical protein
MTPTTTVTAALSLAFTEEKKGIPGFEGLFNLTWLMREAGYYLYQRRGERKSI